MGFHLLGYVVMPEHVHLLMSEPKLGTPSTVLQKLKLRVARKTTEAWKAGVRGADAIAVCRDGGTGAGVLAGAVLRFQCVQQGKEDGETELHACESGDPRTGETSARLAVEQLGVLWGRSSGLVAIDVEE
jgi:hypothetical protein